MLRIFSYFSHTLNIRRSLYYFSNVFCRFHQHATCHAHCLSTTCPKSTLCIFSSRSLVGTAEQVHGYGTQSQKVDTGSINDLLERYWRWRLIESPEFATRCGIHEYDDRLEQLSENAFICQLAKAEDFVRESEQFANCYRLSYEDTLNLTILQSQLNAFIRGYEFRVFSAYNPINVVDGVFAEWRYLLSITPFKTVADYEKLLLRQKCMAIWVDQAIELMRKAASYRLALHQSAKLILTAELKTELNIDVTDSFTFRPFKLMPDSIPKNIQHQLQKRCLTLRSDVLLPAYKKLHTFLATEYPWRSEPGASSLAGGANFYQACLEWHISAHANPLDIHQTGLHEVQRLIDEMEALKGAANFKGTLQEYIQHLKMNPDNYYDSEKTMLDAYRQVIDAAKQKKSLVFRTLTKTDVVVQKTFRREDCAGSYTEPALDGSRSGIFWANVHDAHTRLRYETVALALHEAIPGHHMQAAIAIESKLPNFRRIIDDRHYGAVPFNWPFFTAYIEGWALYAESLGKEMGLYTDEQSNFGRCSSELLRACRLVVDTGIHEFGWSESQAIDYLSRHSAEMPSEILSEVNRYIALPGQACAYKIGQLKLCSLRNIAISCLGASFDIRSFHDKILQLGPVPLDLLETHMFRWIEEHKKLQ